MQQKRQRVFIAGNELPVSNPTQLNFLKNNVIRIHAKEYHNVPFGTFTHFNLSPCTHQPGRLYILGRIMDRADSNPQTEVCLSLSNVFVGKCFDVQHDLHYKDMRPSLFDHSMASIRTVSELQQAMIHRYLPFRGMTEEELLEVPVTATHLKLFDHRMAEFPT